MPVFASDGRPTIGVLMGWQYYWTATPLSYLEPLVRGMRRAAHDLGCHLLLGCGMGVSADASDPLRPAWPLALPETDFVPIGPWNTDGLIAVTPLHLPALSRDIQRIIAAGHPVQFVGSGERGPTIAADNAGGVLAAMRHLVDHGHRQIAFIAGSPEDDDGDSGDRLRAYRAALAEHGLASEARLVAYGRHTLAGGRAAMRAVLGSDAPFTAVLASNDESALGAAEALREAGREIPRDVALFGFDDRPESAAQRPALSSVRVPLVRMGYRAVELLLAQIAGAPPPAEPVRVATSLAPRESCGCGADLGAAAAREADLAGQMARAAADAMPDAPPETVAAVCRRLAASLGDPAAFAEALDDALADPALAETEAHHWQPAITLLRETLPDARTREQLDRARVAISGQMQRQHRRAASQQRWDANRMHILTARLQLALDEEQVFAVLARHLPDMEIARGWVALFEPAAPLGAAARCAIRSLTEPATPPAETTCRAFPPAAMRAAGAPISLAVLPLITPRGQIGFAAFDSDRLDLYGAIVQQLAAALHSAQLYREATEGRRLAEEASQLKSRFLSTVSHELRTPLNVIVGLSGLLARRGSEELPEQIRRDLERISADAQHLGGLIGDVLDLASSDAGQLRLSSELMDLGDALRLVAQTGARLAADKGLAWRADLPERGPWVRGDRTRLRQVALNLVSNAIKFTEVGEVALALEQRGGIARVSVSDTGIGVPPEEQSAMFDEFRRSERSVAHGYSGLGLGLAICRRLVELHGGAIRLTSSGREGEGSTFSFELPLAAEPAADARHADAELATAPAPPERAVLVVDDDPATLDLHARIVQGHWPDAQVLRAANGRAALAILGHTRIDLVLLDLLMPELDGFGVLEAMRQSDAARDTAVIVLTGQPLSRQEVARLGSGVAAVMSKGMFSAAETLARLDAALARRRGLSGEAQRLVRQAMAYVHEHYARPITRQDLARHVGMAEDYLTSCFHKEVGMAPIAYLNRYRVRQAKALLRSSAAPIAAIAAAVGFADGAYFSRIFRRETGVSPDAFRRSPAGEPVAHTPREGQGGQSPP